MRRRLAGRIFSPGYHFTTVFGKLESSFSCVFRNFFKSTNRSLCGRTAPADSGGQVGVGAPGKASQPPGDTNPPLVSPPSLPTTPRSRFPGPRVVSRFSIAVFQHTNTRERTLTDTRKRSLYTTRRRASSPQC